MKLMLAALFISGSALAFTSSTVGNRPVKDPMWTNDKREPSSVEEKASKPSKDHTKKSQVNKKQD